MATVALLPILARMFGNVSNLLLQEPNPFGDGTGRTPACVAIATLALPKPPA